MKCAERTEIFVFSGTSALIRSEAMLQVIRLVERAARTNAAVLITGESGTGKEVIARAVHHYSLRCSKPWVDVSCGALPEHLMESELFGYERGAFSGADTQKPGLFDLAHTGTLLLDEIGELDPRMQVKLLRVLDGAPYYRLGGLRKVSVDVRIVAATNQNLEQAVEAGRFRSDLFHRLNQLRIEVPPLRERIADIQPLAEFFLKQINPDMRLSHEVVNTLCAYSWPGNIRELRNAISAAATFSEVSVLETADLPANLLPSGATTHVPQLTAGSPVCSLEEMERRLIEEALTKTHGHQQRAAALLGISRRTLTRKMKGYREIPGEEINLLAEACA